MFPAYTRVCAVTVNPKVHGRVPAYLEDQCDSSLT